MPEIERWEDPDEIRWYKTPLGTFRSATSHLKVLNKPGIIHWVAKTTAEYIRDKLDDIRSGQLNIENMDIDEIIAAAKKHHQEKLTQAGERGTNIHKAINDFVVAGVVPTLDFETKETVELFKSYLKWTKDLQITTLESEATVYSKHGFAGTLDQVIKSGDQKLKGIWINDFKTGKAIYYEAGLQVSAYLYALLELKPEYKKSLKGAMVTRLFPGGYEVQVYDKKQCRDLFQQFLCIVKYVQKYEKYKTKYINKA